MSGNANMENLDFLAFEGEDENGYRVDILNPSQAAKHIEFEAIAWCAKLVEVPTVQRRPVMQTRAKRLSIVYSLYE